LSSSDHAKAHGVHYTPPELAAFLAEVTARSMQQQDGPIEILDPACGDGELLLAIAHAFPDSDRRRLVLVGYEQDPQTLNRAEANLARIGVGDVVLQATDFLSVKGVERPPSDRQLRLFDPPTEINVLQRYFDAIIANPPYVRTQVLGAGPAQDLARRFGLTGRVDLYQAFMMAMSAVLRPGGVLGLLTSNRFLFIQSGAAVRCLLRTQFDLQAVYDLGDTKLFSAAVLPAIVVARKGNGDPDSTCLFERVYETRSSGKDGVGFPDCRSVLDALRNQVTGVVKTPGGCYTIERGVLQPTSDSAATWSLSTPESRDWIAVVESNQSHVFEDVAKIRVGIKTTADRVFIRGDWDELPGELRPEPELLHALITHHDAARWRISPQAARAQRVLYPHQIRRGERKPVDLDAYPHARTYLESEREVLEARKYVIEAGRRWYEIWVPQDPEDWPRPKLVFPDISEHPRFFLDLSGAVVNGDCYWIVLKPGMDPHWLPLMLAIANSSFLVRYYDTVFHNKLFSRRRRFLAQYVKRFPLPDLRSPAARELVEEVNRIVGSDLGAEETSRVEVRINDLVWNAFGLEDSSR
jgi:methylase of polypeptide subunit release factors